MLFDTRENPFGLIIVLNSDGNADGELFYDDGETSDTIETNVYFYATYDWSSKNCQLKINVIKNNYIHMSSLILDSLAIYGLRHPSVNMTANGKQVTGMTRTQTQIVDVVGLGLLMNNTYIISWMCGETSSNNRCPHTAFPQNTLFYIFVYSIFVALH